MVQELKTVAEFTEALENVNLIVIDFYTDWCGPCKRISPKFHALAKKYPGISCYKINAETPDLEKVCAACQISSLPTFCFFHAGKYKNKMVGADAEILEKMIIKQLNELNQPEQLANETN